MAYSEKVIDHYAMLVQWTKKIILWEPAWWVRQLAVMLCSYKLK